MKVLLDTNICIAVMRGHEKAVARMAALTPGDCVVSVVTVYELFTGIAKCREPERERVKVGGFLSGVRAVIFDEAAAKRAAQVRADLGRSAGRAGHTTCFLPVTRSRSAFPSQRTTSMNFPAWTDCRSRIGSRNL